MGVMIVAALFAVGVAVAPSSASAAACSITMTLRVGSTGAEVMCLQSLVGASADGKFGPMTAAAVKAFQTSKGLAADGVVGAMTRAALMGSAPVGQLPAGCQVGWMFNPATGASCVAGTPDAPSNGALEGGAGSITVSAKSTYTNEDVVAGDEDAKVLAFEVEADDDSDVEVTSVKVELAQTAAGNSDRVEDYMDSVSIFMGSDKIGEADAEDFTENNDIYTKTISVDNAIVRAGETEVFSVAITAASNLDSGDIDDDAFGVDVLNVRFEDADGVVTTEDTDGDTLDRTFDFDDLSTSGDLELKLTEGSENPDAQVVEVDDTTDTDVTMLEFKLKAEGSEMLIDSLLLSATATGVDDTWADMVSDVSLEMDGDELDSVSAYYDGTDDDAGDLFFNDLDLTIGEGDTVTFTVVAKIRDTAATTGATVFDNGDSFAVSFPSSYLDDVTGTDQTDVEDENGDVVVAGNRTGSVTGEAQTFYSTGIAVDFVSVDADPFTVDGTNNDRVELVMNFKVTAFGGDAYIPSVITVKSAGTGSAGTAPTAAEGVGLHLQSSDAQLAVGKGIAILTSSADEEAYTPTGTDATDDAYTSLFKVNDGSSETFTAKVNVDNSIATAGDLDGAQVRAILTGVTFSSGTNVITTAGTLVYTSNLQDDFKTPYATIAD